MFKRKLFKRALPIILSVAMVFQSAPTTAFAAEGTTEPETVIEQSTEEVVGDETDDNGAGSSEAVDGQNEGGNEESKPTETQATAEETKPAETQQTEETKAAEETKTAEETKAAEETKTAEAEKEEEVEEAADNAEATASKAVLSVDEDDLVDGLQSSGTVEYAYDYTTKTIETHFMQDSTDIANDVLAAAKDAVKVTVDEQDNSIVKDHVTYKWQQKGADDKFAAMPDGELPQAAGEYKLVISLGDVDGVCAVADDVSVNLAIKKAEIIVDVNNYIAPGTTVADAKKSIEDSLKLKLDDTEEAPNVKDAYASAVAVEIKEASGTEALKDDATLEKNKDYVFTVSVTLKDDFTKNYEVKSETYNVVLTEAVDTRIQVTYKPENAMLHKLYGEAIDIAKDVTPYYEAKVTYKNDDGKYVDEVPGAEIKATWCDAEQVEYADESFVPTDAGTYYYKLSYTDDKGSYADAEAYIPFVIDPISVVIVPELKETKYNDGIEARAITKGATYKVYQIKEGKPDTTSEVSRDEYFWGVAYNEDKTYDTTQYYEPVFAVQRGVENEDKTITWTTLEDASTLDATSEDGKITYKYRLVFSGKKAVYHTSGWSDKCDINKSQENYTVDVSDAAIGDNAVALELTSAVTIDVSGILQDGKAGESYDNAIISTYTGESIYKTKNDYKKAVAKAGDATVAQNADNGLIYQWEYKNGSTTDEDGNTVPSFGTVWSNYDDVENNSAPYGKGEYRLKIEYSSDGVSSKEPAYVYYTILPQDAMAVLTPSPKKVYMDGSYTTTDFLNELQCTDKEQTDTYVEVAFYTVVDGKKGEDISERTDFASWYKNSIKNPGSYYTVERKIDEGESAGEWKKATEAFISGKSYRLNAYSTNSNYNFGWELDKHGNQVNGAKRRDWNETIEIQELETKGIDIQIDLDESLITNNIKTYDAKPFDLTELKKLVKVTEVKTGNPVGEDKAPLKYEFVENVYDEVKGTNVIKSWNAEDAIHGGKYKLRISIDTNDTYKGVIKTLDKDFIINQKELTVTPGLWDEIRADLYISDGRPNSGIDIITEFKLDGFAGEDNESLIKSLKGYIYDKNEKNPTKYTGWLRSGETYYIASDITFKTEDDEKNPLYGGRDYVVADARTTFVPVKAEAGVTEEDYWHDNEYVGTALWNTTSGTPAEGYTHTITTREGIPYVKGLSVSAYGKPAKEVEGNFFIFEIQAPAEFVGTGKDFSDAFVFENSINDAGGYVLDYGTKDVYDYYNETDMVDIPYIIVAFEADPEKLSENKTFDILWDTGYSEKFVIDFSKSILEDDMSKAVAPKSLAFNGANTKMAVGETQQLDVKITKAQMRDIIMLGYESSDENVLKVTDTGYVTALSKGTATVKVYPCRKVDGVKTAIEGAKAATVKITVSDVAAPKISKVYVNDTWVNVYYQKPANGYRREIYVLEGKQKADSFETAIAAVKNGDYSTFVYASLSDSENVYDSKKNIVYRSIWNLEPEKEYTVYVRNVSGLRALEDGSKVATSHAGAVKTFKTVKAMNEELKAYFDKDLKGQTAFLNAKDSKYHAKLSDKSAQLSVEAKFLEKYSQSYSDNPDYIWRLLPLSKEDKNHYMDPKLSYYVTTGYCDYDNDLYHSVSWLKQNGWYHIGTTWYQPSSLATVDKKGKVTFKGKGEVYIVVYDAEAGTSDGVTLIIDAAPTSIKAKNIKMTVGETVSLKKYLEYKEGKTKLVNYENLYADLSVDQESDEYFTIEPMVRYDGSVYDYKITSLKPGGKLDLTVKDFVVEANNGQPAKVKITSSVVNPVKNLKVKQATDKWFVVSFAYPLSNYEFRFDLKDQRGDTIRTETKTIGTYRSEEQLVDYNNQYDYYWYNAKTKQWEYVVWFNYDEITRLSDYNLTVTALYNEQASKEAKLKVKTTNIPASYFNVPKGDGGTSIDVTTKSNGNIDLRHYPVLKSGNTYTLEMPLDYEYYNEDYDEWFSYDNYEAKQRKTDTLTWKSTNTKVATVKANAGSFTAALKALNKGVTTIEVTSKVTKKVIARWTVRINAVGDAGGYFGDNEPYKWTDDGIGDGVDVEDKDMIEITMNNSVRSTLNKGECQWFVFTAPAYGSYNFYADEHSMSIYTRDNDGKLQLDEMTTWYSDYLEKGAKRYIAIENTNSKKKTVEFSVYGSVYKELKLGENKIKNGDYIRFIAPADNMYTISYVKDGKDVEKAKRFIAKNVAYNFGQLYDPNLTSGEEITVKVTNLEPVKATVGGEGTEVSIGENEEKWFSFTAAETGLYTFLAESADYVSGQVYTNLANANTAIAAGVVGATNTYGIGSPIKIEKGQTVYIKISSTAATKDKAVTAKFKVDKADSIGADGKITGVTVGTEYKTITYVAPSDGNYRVTFSTTTEGATLDSKVNVNNTTSDATNNVYEGYFPKDAFVKFQVKANKEATVSVTVEKTSTTQLKVGDNTLKMAAYTKEAVKFYATESAWYTFKSQAVAVKETKFLKAGEEWSKIILSDKTQDVTITITKEPVNTLADGDIKVAADEIKYYKYTATKEGLYGFKIAPDTGITVEKSDFLDRDYKEYKNIDETYMTAGETFYVRLTGGAAVAENAKATVKISALEVTPLTAGKEETVKVAAGEFKWLEFTAKKTARYEYKNEKADEVDIIWSDSLGGYDDDETFSNPIGEVYSAGTKRYFKVTNSNAEEKEIKLTISEITPVAAETGASLKNGKGQWLVFTSKETATTRYSFKSVASATDKKPGATIEYYIDGKLTDIDYDDLEEYSSDTLDNIVLKSGESIYFYVEASCDGDYAANVTVTATKAGADGDITASSGIAFEANATKALTWTVPEGKGGYYSLSAKVDDKTATGVTVTCYKNLEKEPISIYGGAVKLEAGDTLTFKVTSSVKQTVKFSMDLTSVTPITAEGETISMKNGDVKYFSLTEKDAARYFIETTDIADGLKLSYSVVSGSYASNSFGSLADGYYSFVGKINSEYAFKITATVEGTDAKTFKIKGGVVTATDLKDSATISKANVKPNHYTWYKFTAAEDAKYTFKLKNGNARVISNLNNYSNGSVFFPYQINLKKGEVRYFAVYSTVEPTEDITLSVAKAETTEISEAKPLTLDITKVDANEKVWASFTAPKDGKYVFEADAENVKLVDSSYNSYDLPKMITLEEGKKVTYSFYYTGKPEKNITISVKELAVTNVTAAPTTVSIKNGETKYFTLKETEYARYYIETSDLADGLSLSCVSREVCDLDVWGNLDDGYYSYLGTTKTSCSFALKASFEGDGEKTFKIQGGVVKPEDLNLGTPKTIKAADVKLGHYTWYKFTAPEYGMYNFKIDNYTRAYEYYNDINHQGINASFSSSREEELNAGEVRYFAVYCDVKPTKDVSISVSKRTYEKISDTPTIVSIKNGETKYFTLPEYAAERYYIETFGIEDELTLNARYESGYENYSWGAISEYHTFVGRENDRYNFSITASFAGEGTKNFQIKGGAVQPTVIDVTAPGTILAKNVRPDHDMWFKFMAPTDGSYIFDLSNNEYANISISANLNEYGSTYYSGNVVKLSEGEERYFRVDFNDYPTSDMKFSVEQIIYTEVSDAAQTITIKDGETKYFKFDKESDERYFIETSEVSEGLTLTVNSLSGYPYSVGDINKGYYSFGGNASGEYVFSITADFTDGTTDAKSFTISGGQVTYEELSLGESAKIPAAEVKPGHYTWYHFTASEDGRYIFKLNNIPNADGSHWTSKPLFGSDGNIPSDMERVLYSGDEYYFAVKCNTIPTEDVTFGVTKITPTEITMDEPYKIDTTKVGILENMWISFTVPESGYYTLNADHTNVNSYLYEDILEDSSTYNSLPRMNYFEFGQTVFYKINYNSSTSGDIKVYMEENTVVDEDGAKVSLTLQPNEIKLIPIKPYADALCEIELSQTTNLEKNWGKANTYMATDSQVVVLAGETAVCKIRNKSTTDVVEVEATLNINDPTYIVEGDNDVELNSSNHDACVAFKAVSDGAYCISDDAASDIYVYVNNKRIDSANNNYYIAKDETVVVYVRNYDETTAKVNVTKNDVESINLGEEKTKNGTSSDKSVVVFKAPKAGDYIFKASSPAGTSFALEGKTVKHLESSRTYRGYSIGIPHYLEAGETVFFETWDYSGPGRDYTVSVIEE